MPENFVPNEEYVRRLGIMYNNILSLRKDSDYVVNQPQMDKLVKVLDFFMDVAKELDGHVDPVKLTPREEHGGVTATFLVFDIIGENIPRFCEVMGYTSAISIDSIEEGICISCTVPDVFVKMNKH